MATDAQNPGAAPEALAEAGSGRGWLEDVQRTFPDTVARVDRDGRVLGVFSPHPSRLFAGREALPGTDGLAVVAERERAEVRRTIAATIATGTPALLELEGRDGPVETRVVRSGEDEALLICRFVGKERSAEADQRLLAALMRQMTDAVFVVGPDARIQVWTGGAEAVYGYAAAEVLGRSVVELLSASQRSVTVEDLRTALASGKPVHYRSLSTRRDGRQIVCAASAVPIRDETGAFTRALFVAHDVTREAEMEAELARSRDVLASALESSGLGHWQLDCRTGALSYDHHWPELLGYREDEVAPALAAWVALAEPADVPRVRAAVFAHLKGETGHVDCEFRLRDRKGRWRWIHTRGRVASRDASGRALLLSGTHADVTRRREAEECMRAALEANVRLVAELREALAKVKTLTGLLPVCAWCKRIRDDAGYWQGIETYLAERSDATFTHGMCPECRAREWPAGDDDGE